MRDYVYDVKLPADTYLTKNEQGHIHYKSLQV